MEQPGTPRVVSDVGQEPIAKRLSLLDSTAIIVGIIIGGMFYGNSAFIANMAGGTWRTLAAWAAGGALSLIGALCYAELGAAYPKAGGEYVYLSRAYGRFVGFLYAWGGFWVVRPVSIGAVGLIFGTYAAKLLPLGEQSALWYSLGATIVLTILNIVGIEMGKWTQNVLTLAKVAGLLAVFAVGYTLIGQAPTPVLDGRPAVQANWLLALILVMWAYGGWSDMPMVAAEVRDPQKNIVRALLLGTGAVTAIYLLGTVAFLLARGYQGLCSSEAIAADVVGARLAGGGAAFVSALIAVSCLGAVHGTILTGARVYYALGTDHPLYRWLGRWNQQTGTPVRALAAQGVVALALTVMFAWHRNGLEEMQIFTGPVFWTFLLLTGVALIVLRVTDRATVRPYRVPLYPVTPLIFCASCAFMIYASTDYALKNMSSMAWILAGIMVAGVGAGVIDALLGREKNPRDGRATE